MIDMSMPDRWTDPANVIEHLAEQLILGRLGLFLGAGVSKKLELPDWKSLVKRLAAAAGDDEPTNDFDPIQTAETLKEKHYRNDVKFNNAVRDALYQRINLDLSKISQNKLLSAIGSLVMSSQRGTAAKVFTLNFDNILELYLEYHGFTTAVIHNGRHWARNEDVVVYHPHGFLPFGHADVSERIVLGETEFKDIIGCPEWRPIIETSLRQHTFLYLGLSGYDLHLQSLWDSLLSHHAIGNSYRGAFYHGVRFTTDAADDISTKTEKWRLFTQKCDDYDELPEFLFKICQKARELRSKPV